jgi:uncharacterized membrane protein
MEPFFDWLKALQLHPIADHFTIALLTTGVLLDLVASFAPSRLWLRYSALTLMILGTVATGASFYTGHWEADRVHELVHGPAHEALEWHEEFGHWITYTFIAITLWRLAIQSIEFVARSRQVYLGVAVIAIVALFYQGHLGGELVYKFGIGTEFMQPMRATPAETTPGALMSPEPAPTPTATPAPTATVTPAETPTPSPTPSPESSPAAGLSPSPSPTAATPEELGV